MSERRRRSSEGFKEAKRLARRSALTSDLRKVVGYTENLGKLR